MEHNETLLNNHTKNYIAFRTEILLEGLSGLKVRISYLYRYYFYHDCKYILDEEEQSSAQSWEDKVTFEF